MGETTAQRIARQKIYKQRHKAKDPIGFRRRQREHKLRKFGLTYEQYEEMFRAQDGVCAICLKAETALASGKIRALAVDHDHATGVVRGLLCDRCNRAIGFLADDPLRAESLARYLRRARGVH